MAERQAAATDPEERDRLFEKEFEETPVPRLKVVNMVDELVHQRSDWETYDPEDATYGDHIGEVELLGERRWFVWTTEGYEVTPGSVHMFASQEEAESGWRRLCASHGDVYFDDEDYEDDPHKEPMTSGVLEARVDRQWGYFARATGLPENVSRALMKGRMDALVVAAATGGHPTPEQLAAYEMLAALRL
ncbi:hypothetical protein [Nocardioides piscis]|uniref:Uncharacterized protein n=1 Tax=Nocardioides piscis TaxID=2714938 RepID=A0A6G7YDE7_9ACTN|nr:hypothetical protein [Nocardioides piscis]QIK74749.1 hypothetical protein G7071_04225 [Nocardioides piscis]